VRGRDGRDRDVRGIHSSQRGSTGRRARQDSATPCIAADPEARLRDIAATVGITERTAAHIVSDLEQAGYLTRPRVGRRNRYEIDGKREIRTGRLPTMTVGQLLGVLLQPLEQ
jgi:DNA-binding transcriptional ArsR family regulator